MNTPALITQRCANHLDREAVARCPECARFFCRECITEHEDRVICAACLKRVARKREAGRARFTAVPRTVQCVAGLLAAWLFFYFAGRLLMAVPVSFHEGTLWHSQTNE